MRSSKDSRRCKKSPPAWHEGFVAMLPAIEKYAKRTFRCRKGDAREEAIQETICNACCAYARLVALNKTNLAYPSALSAGSPFVKSRQAAKSVAG